LALEGGDSAAGAQIYSRTQLSCVRCHRIGQSGGEVGPDLSAVGKQRDRRYLLESICLPDAAIAEGFQTVVIADDLGQVFTGIVKHEDDSSVELIQADGQLQRIEQDAITARKRGKSAMPEELVSYLSLRELRDLVAYLASLKSESETAAGK
jgi:quinoprotein glucose dehydrogenase